MKIRAQKASGLLVAAMLAFLVVGSGCGGGGGSSEEEQAAPETLDMFPVNPAGLGEEEKMALVDDETRPYRYSFDNPVSLYVATAPGQPEALPGEAVPVAEASDGVFADPVPVYSNAYRGAFVEKGKDETLWFAYDVAGDTASKVVWQIANRPFRAGESDWQDPEGLIASGEAGGGAGEFSIDFSALDLSKFPPDNTSLIDGPLPDSRLYPKQEPYYVRAVAVDRDENIVGEMDRGIEVLYGSRVSFAPSITDLDFLFYLKTPALSGNPYGEISSPFENYLMHAVYPPMDVDWYFWPEGFPQETDTLYLQVSRSPLGNDPDDWRDPPGLVYEIELTKGMALFDGLEYSTNSIPIDFGIFAIEETEYYVRAVALSPGEEPGTVVSSYSTAVRFVCQSEGTDFTYYPPPEPTIIEAPMPEVSLVAYEPFDLEEPDWMYWYEVVRTPTVREYTYGIVPDDSPVEDLAPGDYFRIALPSDDDDSWIEEAWDTISDFFGSIIDYAAKVTDWVASAYNDLKADLISYAAEFVAENLPGLPQSLRDDLQEALEFTANCGLAAIGIPPELPSFDQLSEQGLDYLAANALDMAGIPDTDLTEEMVKDLAADIGQGLQDAATSGDSPNPLNWTFVRQYPGALYRPAYILVEVHNPYDSATPSGTLSGRVFHYLDADELSVPEIGDVYAAYGGSTYFELYRPVDSVPIPSLLPGQTIKVPVYLYEYTGACYPWSTLAVRQNDFYKMYNYFEDFTFSFRIDFDLPTAEQYASEQGMDPNASGYEYATISRGFNFTGDPAYAYVP